ncbi:hypothetical protein [Streptomyces variegatus]|uniref:hypothetical protein n=1 Tax=Streptomyces variegatus TaxID=284040 RepID=UPI003C2BA2F3
MLDVPGLPGLPLPDPVPKILYVLFPDGMLGQVTTTAGAEPVLTEGAKLVTQERYEELRAQMRERHEARLAEMEAVEAQLRREQYDDLRAAGVREATARSLSGYDGPAEEA